MKWFLWVCGYLHVVHGMRVFKCVCSETASVFDADGHLFYFQQELIKILELY